MQNINVDSENMKKLIKELKKENLTRFEEFYDLTIRQVYYSIIQIVKSRTEAQDISQEVYMKFLSNIKHYKGGNVIAYLVTIAKRLAINHYHKKKREVLYDTYDNEINFGTVEPSQTPIVDALRKILKENEFEVFILHVVQGFKHKDIAKMMGKPLGTITWLYNEAVKRAKKELGEYNE